MTFLDMGVVGIATWRATSLVVNEAGPWGVFLRLREFLGIGHNNGQPETWEGEGLAALFSCVWCMSVWMGGLIYLVWWLSPIPTYILAASGLACLGQEVIERLRR